MKLTTLQPSRLLKQTQSRCPACLAEIDAQVLEAQGRVVMRKHCPQHGSFEVVLANHPRFYYDSRGASREDASCGSRCACASVSTAPDHTPDASAPTDPFEVLSTCIALIEIVDSCNLKCPTCFASSPWTPADEVRCTPFDQCVSRVQGVVDRKGTIDILQLSGGEPTIHPEFFRILDWSLDHPKIGYVLINTNAIRAAGDAEFRERLGYARRTKGKFELYVQFDGVQSEGQVALRAGDFRAARAKAVDLCGQLGVPSTLAMTVTPDNLHYLGDAMRFGMERPHCRGIVFQPMFHSGRTHVGVSSGTLPVLHTPPPASISVGDVIVTLCAQSQGLLTEEDFTPLPCGDPNCHTIGYVLRAPGGPVPLRHLIDMKSMQGFLRDRADYRLEDLARCGCESEPLGQLLASLELKPEHPFRLFIKPFMDARTFDQDRIDRCCTHVIRPDGSLDSFCRYYLHAGSHAPPV